MEDISNNKLYHPKQPALSPLWRLLNKHYEKYEQVYDERFKNKYGFFRPVINKVVYEYLRCGDLKEGFARVRCADCEHEHLLSFSCKGRWFCPSCHAQKVIHFGELLKENILYPVPHRQYVFSIPIMLRVYFKHNRDLLTKLCRCTYESVLLFLRNVTGLKTGIPGLIMTIHTFGNYPDKFHPHLHAIVTDGLFNKNGTFYVMPKVQLKPLEEIFRAGVFRLLQKEGKITDELIDKMMKWRYSGFSINNGLRIKRDDGKGRESVAQYILRNPFSVEKMTYNDKSGTVIYRSKMTHGRNKKNFNAYTAEEFIAAISQHIPEKAFQMVRYYGWYSNKSRGLRLKRGLVRAGDEPSENDTGVEIIDVSEYEPKRIPSKTWRECIKKIWEVDPLQCPNCGGEMKIISFITEASVIRQILQHLGLWSQTLSRDPPNLVSTDNGEIIYEPFDDGWTQPRALAL